MTKGRTESTIDTGMVPPQTRSLRSRKRQLPDCQNIVLSDNVQPTLPQQGIEGIVATSAASSPQTPQPPLQGCTKRSTQQEQAAEQTVPSMQESNAVEKYLVAATICAEHVIIKAVEGPGQEHVIIKAVEGPGQRETILTHSNKDAQCKNTSDYNQDEEEINTRQYIKSPPHTPTEQPRPPLPTSREGEIGEEACVTICEEGTCRGENLEPETESNRDSQQEPDPVCMGDGTEKEVTREAAVEPPAKRRRRMGMCGLTEKERSHFLQVKKCETGTNETEGDERQAEEVVSNKESTVSLDKDCKCQSDNKEADLVAEGEIILPVSSSSPLPPIAVGSIAEQRDEMELLSVNSGGEVRGETDVCISMTTSEGLSHVWNPICEGLGCSEGEPCQADPSLEPGPGRISDPGIDLPAKEEGNLANYPLIREEPEELEGHTHETVVENSEKQRKGGEEGSGESHCFPATTNTTTTSHNVLTEKEHQELGQKFSLQMESVTKPRDGTTEVVGGEVRDGVSSQDTGPVGFHNIREEHRVVAATPSGSEENGHCGPDVNPGTTGLAPVNTEHPQSRDTSDPFGSCSLDYVSDSQLNNIVLIEEQMMEGDGGPCSSDCHEDATDLVCGLIRELSSLNQRVMATHRDLENLRRGNKGSRAPVRRRVGVGPRHSDMLPSL